MRRTAYRSFALLAAGFLGLATTAPPAHGGKLVRLKKCTEITEPGSYELKGDLPDKKGLLSGGRCLVIAADFVTLDLRGHTITGNGAGDCITDGGNARQGTIIRDGTVTGCVDGIDFSASSDTVIDTVRAIGNSGSGILAGVGTHVRKCVSADNVSSGISVTFSGTVTDSTARNNGGAGISADDGSTVAGNAARGNGLNGISALGGITVTGNAAQQNGANGIFADDGSTVTGNTVVDNGSNGIRADFGCTVTDNTARDNGDDGLDVFCPSNIRGNTATSNSATNLVTNGAGCNLDNNVAP